MIGDAERQAIDTMSGCDNMAFGYKALATNFPMYKLSPKRSYKTKTFVGRFISFNEDEKAKQKKADECPMFIPGKEK